MSEAKERKLIERYESLSSGATLKDVIKAMENRIDARLVVEEWSMTVEYKSYETDFEYNSRIKREANIAAVKDTPEFKEYLKLHERFKYFV